MCVCVGGGGGGGGRGGGIKPVTPLDHQSDAHLTEPPRRQNEL